MKLRIAEIIKLTGERTLCSENKYCNLEGISTDSRKLKKGELFVALKGEKFNGNDFISDAFKKGAIGAIVSNEKSKRPKTYKQFLIHVPDTLEMLGDIAKYYRGKFKIPLVAITGSCGKTTTKEIMSSILSSKFKVLKTPSNYNNLIGLPLTLFNLTGEEDVVVAEMGMSQPGEIKRLTEISQPDVAVITNVGKAHIGFFNSLKEIAKAKAELFRASVKPKISVLNRDDEFFPYFFSKAEGETITFGTNRESDFRADKVTFDSLGRASFYLNGKKKIKLPFIGRGNIYNVLASLAVAHSMGVKIEEAVSILSRVELPSGRSKLYKLNGVYILDDTYNANPSSFINLLETIEKIKIKGKKILVFGDMLELGEAVKEEHIRAGRLISGSSVDILITVGKNTKFISKTILGNKRVWCFDDHSNANKKIENLLGKGDLLVVKGSRAMGMEKFLPC